MGSVGCRFGLGVGLGMGLVWVWVGGRLYLGEAHCRRENEIGQPSAMRGHHLPRASKDGEGAEGAGGWRGLEG